MLDSVHFRRALAERARTPPPARPPSTPRPPNRCSTWRWPRQIATRETAYSQPLAFQGLPSRSRSSATASRCATSPRLKFGGAHLTDPDAQWAGDVTAKVLAGLAGGLVVAALGVLLAAFLMRRSHDGTRGALRDIAADRTHIPVRAGLATFAVVCLIAGPMVALAGSYHVLGTDRTGNDVLYQSLKSVRTAFVIGTLATMATLPFAIVLGVLAGYLKGWVDEAIQYVYTTLTSVPNVLLIAACVLMVQVYLDQHAEMFETGSERSDLKIFLLCVILGLTGWATLCRLIRGETLKLRELDFVQAATAFGVSPAGSWRATSSRT